jgi:hypothetical protein
MYVTTAKGGVLAVSLDDVALIEVEDVVPPTEPSDYHTRTVRFTTYEGETLEICCDAVGESSLQVREVEDLPPAEKLKVRKRRWLRPRLYKPK